jgi:hypothetical protein
MSDLQDAVAAVRGDGDDFRDAVAATRGSSLKDAIDVVTPNPLDGFVWGIADNPAAVPDSQRGCVRVALCALMGWSYASPEARSIPVGPPDADLQRLCEEKPELGLVWHGQGEHLTGDMRGIVCGLKPTVLYGIQGHAEFADQIGDIAGQFVGISGVITRGR